MFIFSRKLDLPKYKYKFKFQIIAITLIVSILILILIFVSSQFKSLNKTKGLNWENAKVDLSLSLLNKIINDKPQVKPENLKFMSISKDNLYLFDFNSPQLCGTAGCVYSLYDSTGKLLLQVVADSSLPPKSKFKFIDTYQNTNNKLPCIIFSQADWNEPKVSHTEFCYVQSKFKPVNQTFSNF